MLIPGSVNQPNLPRTPSRGRGADELKFRVEPPRTHLGESGNPEGEWERGLSFKTMADSNMPKTFLAQLILDGTELPKDKQIDVWTDREG